jgi:hypothetical protein
VKQADYSIHQHVGWDAHLHVFAFTARAFDIVIAAEDDERHASLVQALSDLGGVATVEGVIDDSGG